MAEFDSVSVDQLGTIALTVDGLLTVANVNGKLYKSRVGDFLTFAAPILSAVGASGLVFPDGSNVLPNPTATVKGSIVGAGTFTWSGGSLTTTSLLNIIATNGTSWVLVKGIGTGDLVSRTEFNALGITSDASGNFTISDSSGNIAVQISNGGLVSLSGFSSLTINRLKTQLGLNDLGIDRTVDNQFNIVDSSGNSAFRITETGLIAFSGLTATTLQKLRISLGVSGSVKKVYSKKVAILTDSIGAADGSSGIAEQDTFLGLLRTKQNCITFRNSVPGSSIMTGGEAAIDLTDDARWQSLNSSFTPDVILIEGGINDFLQDLPLGVITDTSKTVSFYGALNYLYRNMLARYSNTRIFHMTPLHTMYAQGGGLIPEYNGQNFLTDYVEAIKKVAARYGVGIIDTNQKSGITCYNIASLAPDLIHIKEAGHLMVYNTIVNELENYL